MGFRQGHQLSPKRCTSLVTIASTSAWRFHPPVSVPLEWFLFLWSSVQVYIPLISFLFFNFSVIVVLKSHFPSFLTPIASGLLNTPIIHFHYFHSVTKPSEFSILYVEIPSTVWIGNPVLFIGNYSLIHSSGCSILTSFRGQADSSAHPSTSDQDIYNDSFTFTFLFVSHTYKIIFSIFSLQSQFSQLTRLHRFP